MEGDKSQSVSFDGEKNSSNENNKSDNESIKKGHEALLHHLQEGRCCLYNVLHYPKFFLYELTLYFLLCYDPTLINYDKQTSNLDNAAWLKSKYPMGLSGHSAFLQKKLAKGQKYFDSGDYQMARQTTGISKGRQSQASTPFFNFPTGEAIPTPESVPVRKTSIIQPKFHVPAPPTSPPVACTSNLNPASTNHQSNL